MNDGVDKNVPIPKPIASKRKWFDKDLPPRNKILAFTGSWKGPDLPPPELSSDDIKQINEMIADGKDPKIALATSQRRKETVRAKPVTDPLQVTLSALNMKRDGNRFIKNEEEECDS